MENNLSVKNNSVGRGFINNETMANKHMIQKIPDIGMTPEEFRDPEYSLLAIFKLIEALRKVIISMMDNQLVELTEKNMNAFIFLLSIVEICNDNQFNTYNMCGEKDQLAILKEIKSLSLYIAYDYDKDTQMVLYKLVKILNDNTKEHVDGC